MKTTIHAQVVAKAISFPDHIDLLYQLVDEQGNVSRKCYMDGPYSWDTVKMKFFIDPAYALECEGYFKDGHAALIKRPGDLVGEWVDADPDDIPTVI